ncbi:MAG: hypothetical protein ACJ75S_12725 [Solirubrobacterales bacterium]
MHFESPRWIPIQARELQRHIGIPFQTWTSLEGIDPSYGRYFDNVIAQGGPHADKLNHLALEIAHAADDDDLLMFLDGDAFPIANLVPLMDAGLRDAPLMAVKRGENGNDTQPHPCFCVTSVGEWKALRGDWTKGYIWNGLEGKPTTDVGANLLRRLNLTSTPWTPLLRTNSHNPHPVFFGIYGNAVYHHGAGFRWPVERIDWVDVRQIPTVDLPVLGPIVRRIERIRHRILYRRLARQNRRLSEEIFRLIEQDDRSWLDRLA